MLIQALNDYYSVLEKSGNLIQEGYEKIDISYLIELNIDGELVNIIDIRDKKVVKNKEVITMTPRKMDFPERPRSTTINANYVENRPGYIFGLEYISGNGEVTLSTESPGATEKQKSKIKLQHESFKKEVKEDFGDMNSYIARAYVKFASEWNPEDQRDNKFLTGLKSDLNSKKFAFCLAGHPEILLHEDHEVKERWKHMNGQNESSDSSLCQCSVTGEMLPVAKVHNAVQRGKGIGVRNAGINPSLVNFKPESFQSYDHRQGENACISQRAMKRYTTSLNWLLTSPLNHCYLDGLTLFFWSSDGNKANESLMQKMLSGSGENRSDEIDSALLNIMKGAGNALTTDEQIELFYESFNFEADFYIVGLAPNVSRIQVKFIYRKKFGSLLDNIARHQNDLRIREDMKPVSLFSIKNELTSRKITNREKRVYAPFNALFNAIINGIEYPAWCMSETITRIRKDRDTDENHYLRFNDTRVGLIKACLIRHYKEDISMSLDKNNTDTAYLCGRLFSCLEKIQRDASPTKLNRTICDSYFSTAMTTPAAVFPRLIALSNHHLSKIRKQHESWAATDSKLLTEIMGNLAAEFPKTLTMYDQGKFVLGYYQQKQAFFTKSDDSNN